MTETSAVKQSTAGQQLIFSALAGLDAIEQVQAVLAAISNGVNDEGVAERVRLKHIGTLTEISKQMLTEVTGGLTDSLDAVTTRKPTTSER